MTTKKDLNAWLVACLTLSVQAHDAKESGDQESMEFFIEAVASAIKRTDLATSHMLLGVMIERLTHQFLEDERGKKHESAD